MEKNFLLIAIGQRKEIALDVQKILCDYGCIIKTRLGLHEGGENNCSNQGVIILELIGAKAKMKELSEKLQKFEKMDVKLVTLAL